MDRLENVAECSAKTGTGTEKHWTPEDSKETEKEYKIQIKAPNEEIIKTCNGENNPFLEEY